MGFNIELGNVSLLTNKWYLVSDHYLGSYSSQEATGGMDKTR